MWLFSEVTRILKQSGGGVVEWEQGWRGGSYDESGLEMEVGGGMGDAVLQLCVCFCVCV